MTTPTSHSIVRRFDLPDGRYLCIEVSAWQEPRGPQDAPEPAALLASDIVALVAALQSIDVPLKPMLP